MRLFLIFISSLVLSFGLHAQKKIQDGSFIYSFSNKQEGEDETEIGRILILQRDNKQRMQISLNVDLPTATPPHIILLFDFEKDLYSLHSFNQKQELIDVKEGSFSDYKKEVLDISPFKDFKFSSNKKEKRTIEGYSCYQSKLNLEDSEKQAPSFIVYQTNKIKIEHFGLFYLLFPGLQTEGFPFAIDVITPKEGARSSINLTKLIPEKPDAIWFDLDKTPVYPLFSKQESPTPENDQKKDLTLFWGNQYQLNADLIKDYETSLEKSLTPQLSSAGKTILKENSSTAKQIEKKYDHWINALGQANTPDDATGVLDFFTETRLNEMNTLWEKRLEQLVKSNQQIIDIERLSAKARIKLEELNIYQPAIAFGIEKERYQNLTIIQAIAVLRHLQNNNRMLSVILMNQLLKGKNSANLVYDKFEILQTSPKPYILLGEQYESKIILGASSSKADCRISVNGQQLMVENGAATYKVQSSSLGEQKYTARIAIRNPLTDMEEVVSRDFYYEVGVPSATIAADKMNVLYLGIDNPISVAAAGVSSNDLEVKLSKPEFGELKKVGHGKYSFIPKKIGRVEIEMRNINRDKMLARFSFRVKRIPDPRVQLGTRENTGSITAAELNETPGLMTMLENFDFDTKCLIQSFQLNYLSANGTFKTHQHTGAAFMGETRQIIQEAKAGDFIIFSNIKVRCNGDKASRRVSNLGIIVD